MQKRAGRTGPELWLVPERRDRGARGVRGYDHGVRHIPLQQGEPGPTDTVRRAAMWAASRCGTVLQEPRRNADDELGRRRRITISGCFEITNR